MSEIELIIRIMLAHVYYYGNVTMLEFSEDFINKTVPQMNALFCKYEFKTDLFNKDENSMTYKKYKNLMLSIFGDSIYKNDKPFNENWFGLYDDELQCLDMGHLSYDAAKKWISLEENYDQKFIETGSYILSDKIEVYESERTRLEENMKEFRFLK